MQVRYRHPMSFCIQYTWDGPFYSWRGHRLNFPNKIIFISLKIDCVLANSADPDEMLCYVAFHLGFHCLPKYLFSGLQASLG